MKTNLPTVKDFVDRVLRLKDEQDSLGRDIREVLSEAKDAGFELPALGAAITAIRRRNKAVSNNQLELFEAQAEFIRDYLGDYYTGEDTAEPAA